MAKIGPYPRARRASRLWYNTIIFPFSSGRKGKRPLGRKIPVGFALRCYRSYPTRIDAPFDFRVPTGRRYHARTNDSGLVADTTPVLFVACQILATCRL